MRTNPTTIQRKHTYSNGAIERGPPGTRMNTGLAKTASNIYIFLFIYIYMSRCIFFYSSVALLEEGFGQKVKPIV